MSCRNKRRRDRSRWARPPRGTLPWLLASALVSVHVGCDDEGGPSAHAGPMLDAGGGGGSGGSDAGSSGTGGRDIAPPNSGTGGHESIACDPHPDDPCLACLVSDCCPHLGANNLRESIRRDGGLFYTSYSDYDGFFSCVRACVEQDADAGSPDWDQLLACARGCDSRITASSSEEFLHCTVDVDVPVCSGSGGRFPVETLLICAIAGPLFSDRVDAGPGNLPTDADAGSRGLGCADVCFPGLVLSEP